MIYQLHLEQNFIIIIFLDESIIFQLDDKKIIKQKID